MLKVTQILSSISRANGGVSESVRRLSQSLTRFAGIKVDVVSLRDSFTAADAAAWDPILPRCLDSRGPAAFGYAPGFVDALMETSADVTHTAGLWMYPSVANRSWMKRTGRPTIISPHGMLDAWALRNSAWKKNLAATLFEREHLQSAACLHALCQAEADSIRAYGLTNPICIIPNGVDEPQPIPPGSRPVWHDRVPADHRVLLFLGRLHPKKGLSPLVDAWNIARPAGWHLAIAGWDQGGHQATLEQKLALHGIADRVSFVGPLHGSAKAVALASAHGFILPSFSEGLPMTVLEAWANSLPVLMTSACNLPEGFAAGAAIKVTTEPDALAAALTRFCALSDEERTRIGDLGFMLAREKFSWRGVAESWMSVYGWVTGHGKPPPSVVS